MFLEIEVSIGIAFLYKFERFFLPAARACVIVELTCDRDEQLLEFLLEIRHRIERTIKMLDKSCERESEKSRMKQSMKEDADLLSIDCVVNSKLVFGSFAVESTAGVVVMVVDDDADGDDEPLRW